MLGLSAVINRHEIDCFANDLTIAIACDLACHDAAFCEREINALHRFAIFEGYLLTISRQIRSPENNVTGSKDSDSVTPRRNIGEFILPIIIRGSSGAGIGCRCRPASTADTQRDRYATRRLIAIFDLSGDTGSRRLRHSLCASHAGQNENQENKPKDIHREVPLMIEKIYSDNLGWY